MGPIGRGGAPSPPAPSPHIVRTWSPCALTRQSVSRGWETRVVDPFVDSWAIFFVRPEVVESAFRMKQGPGSSVLCCVIYDTIVYACYTEFFYTKLCYTIRCKYWLHGGCQKYKLADREDTNNGLCQGLRWKRSARFRDFCSGRHEAS